uniref:nucleotidyltransferase family protein n=1 Tax=Prevotella sp. TaxID=59823 RepID=UPI00402504E4
MTEKIYYKFIQFALGTYEGKEFLDGSALNGFDWQRFYDFAKKQTLVGIIMEGISRLPKAVAPKQGLLMNWFMMSQNISRQNMMLNAATAEIYNKVKAAGYDCCILKGQANAAMYANPATRTPGDVDMWVDASREEIRQLAQTLAKENGRIDEESYNHIALTTNGISVELHYTPGFMANFTYNRRLQQWFRESIAAQCRNMIALPDEAGEVAAPTAAFNAVYQLYHLYHHYFYEGVGLRQVVDYYYVMWNMECGMWSEECGVKNSSLDNSSSQAKPRTNQHSTFNIQHSLTRLGLWHFAGAMMYVLHEVLGLPEEKMIAPMDKKRGEMLLNDILCGGNFGHHDERHAWGRDTYDGNGFKHGALGHNLLRLHRDLRLLKYYPSEALSEPIFRLWHYYWRWKIHQL